MHIVAKTFEFYFLAKISISAIIVTINVRLLILVLLMCENVCLNLQF